MAKPQVIVTKLLGDEHKGMKVSATGMVKRLPANTPVKYTVIEMVENLKEAADAFYDGDPTKCDEFFQLYCLDDKRPE